MQIIYFIVTVIVVCYLVIGIINFVSVLKHSLNEYSDSGFAVTFYDKFASVLFALKRGMFWPYYDYIEIDRW